MANVFRLIKECPGHEMIIPEDYTGFVEYLDGTEIEYIQGIPKNEYEEPRHKQFIAFLNSMEEIVYK